MDWSLLGLEIVAIMAFCSLLDWFTSKKEQRASKNIVVGWYVRLGEFNYRQSMEQSIVFCNGLFDRIYGKKHFSWRCILVSFAISIMSMCLIALFTDFYQKMIRGTLEGRSLDLILLLSIVNPLADYISLIETRYLLRLAAKGRLRYWPLWLSLDVFLTASILLFFFLFMMLIIAIFHPFNIVFTEPVDNLAYYIKDFAYKFFRVMLLSIRGSTEESQTLRPVVLSTFSTSIIFYFYCLSALIFKLLGLAKTRLLVLLQRLEENDKLFKAIGAFISACLVFTKAIIAIVQHIG